jgi:acetylornithine deacetylase
LSQPTNLPDLLENKIDRKRTESLLSRLLQYPSYQTDLFEKDPMVLNFIKDVVYDEVRNMGVSDVSIDATGNLIARVKSNRGGPRLMLVSYAMTGAPESMKEPFSGKITPGESLGIEGNVVWGRGACEQKSTLGAMLTTVKLLTELDLEPAGDLILVVSTSGESGTHESLRQVVEIDHVKAERGIIAGEQKIQVANKGRVDVSVTVEGKPYHSRMPWKASDAIHGMFLVYGRLYPKLIPYPSDQVNPQLGRATLVSTGIESFPKGDLHTTQSKCVLNFDRRLLPGEDPMVAAHQIEETVGNLEDLSVEVQMGNYLLPSEVPIGCPLVKDLGLAASKITGKNPELEYSHAAYDAGYLNSVGIESVRYGAGNEYFPALYHHTDTDVVSVNDVVNVSKVFAYMALEET